MAQLMALSGNVAGGRSTKKENKVKDTTPFEPLEFIPPYASYTPILERYGKEEPLKGVDIEALRELYERRNEISSLFYMSLPWPSIRERLGITED